MITRRRDESDVPKAFGIMYVEELTTKPTQIAFECISVSEIKRQTLCLGYKPGGALFFE